MKGRPKFNKYGYENPLSCKLSEKQLLSLLGIFNGYISYGTIDYSSLEKFFFLRCHLRIKHSRLFYYLMESISRKGLIAGNWQHMLGKYSAVLNIYGRSISAHMMANTICKYRENVSGNDYSTINAHSGKPVNHEIIDDWIESNVI